MLRVTSPVWRLTIRHPTRGALGPPCLVRASPSLQSQEATALSTSSAARLPVSSAPWTSTTHPANDWLAPEPMIVERFGTAGARGSDGHIDAFGGATSSATIR